MLDGIELALHRRFHRTASLMAQDHEERRVQVGARILHAAHDLGRNDVSGDSNDEQLAEIGVENQFGWYARIAAAKNGRVRLLPSRQVGESLLADGGETGATLKKSVVTLGEALQGFVGGDGGLMRVGGHSFVT